MSKSTKKIKKLKPKKETKKSPFADPKYQKIVRAVGEGDFYIIDFVDGARKRIFKDDIYHEGRALDNAAVISKNGRELSILVSSHFIKVPWTRIRYLSDPEFKKKYQASASTAKIVDWSKWLRSEMEKRGINASQLSSLSGISHGALSTVLSGANKPRLESIQKILSALKMSWADLDNA